MLIIFFSLLMLRVGRCADDQVFDTTTVSVGHNVTLTCALPEYPYTETVVWVRLVSENLPEFLGKTWKFVHHEVTKNYYRRMTLKQQLGTFLLQINEAELSDTGIYYCIHVTQIEIEFSKGTFLRIRGPEPDVTAITEDSPSDPVRPGDSVTLECSVFSEKKTCPEEHGVYWFRAGSDKSHPSLIYVQGNKCEKSLEAHSPQKCVYSFSKNISSSDAGTYYCAVAKCGEILFGNRTKLDIEELKMWDLQKANAVLVLLFAALAISLIVNAFLVYSIKMKMGYCYNADVALQTNAATASGDHQSQQRNEDSLVYSAPTFTKRKTGRAERKNVKVAKGETIYNDVRTLVMD